MIKVLCCACFVLVSAVAAAQSQPNATHTLYLIRHGAYVADRNADPQLGPGITALGVAQARLIAAQELLLVLVTQDGAGVQDRPRLPSERETILIER